jgi:transcriptional regulator with XRE-family HTH domain
MTEVQKVLAANMKAFRRELELTQSELAERAGTTKRYIAKIEVGINFPSPEMLERLALALNKKSPELFGMNPIQKNWQEIILVKIKDLVAQQIVELNNPSIPQNNNASEWFHKSRR